MARATILTPNTIDFNSLSASNMKDLSDCDIYVQDPQSLGTGEQRRPVYAIEYDPDTNTIQIITEPV